MTFRAPVGTVANRALVDRTGTVLRASLSATTGERYYTVAMDIDDPAASGVVFAEGEIEADV
jgi:hypothetical protein